MTVVMGKGVEWLDQVIIVLFITIPAIATTTTLPHHHHTHLDNVTIQTHKIEEFLAVELLRIQSVDHQHTIRSLSFVKIQFNLIIKNSIKTKLKTHPQSQIKITHPHTLTGPSIKELSIWEKDE